jgi:hypothetical protein
VDLCAIKAVTHMSLSVPRLEATVWLAVLHRAVNKRHLSIGETGEFANENLGFGLNPGVEPAPPRSPSSNRRKSAARENLRNVADTGQGDGARCCQQHAHFGSRSKMGADDDP